MTQLNNASQRFYTLNSKSLHTAKKPEQNLIYNSCDHPSEYKY